MDTQLFLPLLTLFSQNNNKLCLSFLFSTQRRKNLLETYILKQESVFYQRTEALRDPIHAMLHDVLGVVMNLDCPHHLHHITNLWFLWCTLKQTFLDLILLYFNNLPTTMMLVDFVPIELLALQTYSPKSSSAALLMKR